MKPFKNIAVLFFSFFLILDTAVHAGEAAGPALWTLKDDDTTIYILGTIHLINSDVKWDSPKIMEAFEASDVLILEMAPDQFEPKKVKAMVVKHAHFTDGQTLPRVLTGKAYARVERELKKLGLPSNNLDNIKPWMVATFITIQVAQVNGFLPQLGVDRTLMEKALAEGKPVQGLETIDDQFGVFSGLPMDTQVAFLEDTLEQISDLKVLFEILRDSWLAGDLETLNDQLNQGWENYPELREAILDSRNENWVEEFSELMNLPGKYFVAVGTGHLVGKKNIISLLEEAGFKVTRQ